METEETFLIDIEINHESLSSEDLELSKHFVETTRHLQELHQWFLIFKKNIDILQGKYTLYNGGKVFVDKKEANTEQDFILINTLIINIIASGRTLVQSIDCYIEENNCINQISKKKYFDYCNEIYDSSFSYRLLTRLRDYSQHGHLPVSFEKNSYCFDLLQIKNKPHFNHNKRLEEQLVNIIEEVITSYHDTPTIPLTETVAEYTVSLFSIYKMFLYQIENELIQSYKKFQILMSKYPSNIIHLKDSTSKFFVYEIVEKNAHLINIDDNSQKMIKEFKREAEKIFCEYKEAYKEVMCGNKYIQKYNNKKIYETGLEFAEKILNIVTKSNDIID